jgi:hypothetical protein
MDGRDVPVSWDARAEAGVLRAHIECHAKCNKHVIFGAHACVSHNGYNPNAAEMFLSACLSEKGSLDGAASD